jgi:hypothetical protein
MLLFIIMLTIVAGGLTAIALAHPPRAEIVVWNDDAERRMLRERKISLRGW